MQRHGRLFYLVGPSGAGKDSLLGYARQHVPDTARLLFAHRYITRPADAGGENHIALSPQEFSRRQALGCFAMHWRSHGLDYGIGSEILQWLAQGCDVVVNGSRAYLDEAQARYPQLLPILVQAPEAVLRDRLQARGRESREDVERRVRQAVKLDCALAAHALQRISNDGELAAAGNSLLRLLLGDPADGTANR